MLTLYRGHIRVNQMMETVTNTMETLEPNGNEWENDDFRMVLRFMDKATQWMKLEEDVMLPLRQPKRCMTVIVPVRMDDESVRSFIGYRVHHDVAMGPAKGGVRFNGDLSMGEVAAMAMLMTWKCSLMNLPFGGSHGGIRLDTTKVSKGELERATRRYCSEIIELIGPNQDVQGPDLNTTPQTMAWMLDTFSVNVGHTVPSVVTGKPKSIGGSLSAHRATGYGVSLVTRNVVKKLNLGNEPTVAIEGFGLVGSEVARGLHNMGFKVIAVSDSKGGIYNADGLDVHKLLQHQKQSGGRITDFEGSTPISNQDLLELACDVLVPCAVRFQINLANVEKIRAKIIVEGANAPITPEADEILDARGIIVVPDILANGAAESVGYFEWVQGLMRLLWTEEEVWARLEEITNKICNRVFAVADEYKCSMRMAAMRLALDRVVEARWHRGLYP